MADIYLVHCIDTEGPLYESLSVTFDRIAELTGVRLSPSLANLRKVQNEEIDLQGYEGLAKQIFSLRLLDYNSDWPKLDKMLDVITSKEFRMHYQDSFGEPWLYSWFIMDHADYDVNPRRRDIGYNNIYQHYKDYYTLNNISYIDDFEWHAHPASVYREANHCDTSYMNSPHIIQSLAHRVIDCGSFPICFRPGVHTERPDSHWLLEQFIPYDYANQSVKQTKLEMEQADINGGRFGDWRRAPDDWRPYHPAHDDYQAVGDCNRVIFRVLNVGTRLRLLTQEEVNKAFLRALGGQNTIIAFCDHDFRNIMPDIDEVYRMLKVAHNKYPDVVYHNSTAHEAAKIVTMASGEKIKLTVSIERKPRGRVLIVESNIDTFGPQPFLAIHTKGGRYIVENFDFQIPKRKWTYTFDDETIHADDVDKIGIATNSMEGTGYLCVMNSDGRLTTESEW
jgi:hypothetical protein